MFHVPNKYRITTGPQGSNSSIGNNGAFLIRSLKLNRPLRIIASQGAGWEHVSVSLPDRCPSWNEMCFIKNIFWDDVDMAVQFHPPISEYVDCHPYCLHLWRKEHTNDFCETPPSILVGPPETIKG